MAPQTQVRTIRIQVDAKGDKDIKNITDQFARMNKTLKSSESSLSTLKNMFMGLTTLSIGGMGISQITGMMDAYQKLSDRIAIFSGSAEKGAETMDKLVNLAARNKTTIESTATVYSRLALSLQDVGISSEGVLMMTENLQNTFRLSGATIAEATGATIQLSQGLASGTLRGQELRAVLEANALMGEILAEEFNATRGQLMKLGEAGKITSDRVFSALLKNSDKLTKQAEKLTVTFSEANDRGLMRFNVALGELNKELELSTKYDNAIQTLADNWKILAAVLSGLAITTLPYLIGKLNVLTLTIRALVLSNPLTALAAGIVAAGVYIVAEWESWEYHVLKFTAEFNIALKDAAIGMWEFVKSTNDALGAFKVDAIDKYAKNQIAAFTSIRDSWAATRLEVKRNYVAMQEADKALAAAGAGNVVKQLQTDLEKLQAANKAAATASASLREQIEALNQGYNNGFISVEKYNSELRRLTELLYSKKDKNKLLEELQKVDLGNLQRNFEEGKISIERFNEETLKLNMTYLNTQLDSGRISAEKFLAEMDKLNQAEISSSKAKDILALREMDKQVRAGTLSMEAYRNAEISMNQNELKAKLDANLISMEEYNSKMLEVSGNQVQWKRAAAVGLDNYIKDAENFNMQFSKVVTSSLGHLEDAFVSFTETGKFDFKNMADSILKDLNRVILRAMIMAPILRGIQNGTGLNLTAQADGGAWDGGVQFYAKGGVVNSPTMFQHSGGLGVMGEAGPEAIMPLQRGPDGKLGVRSQGVGSSNVVVNVINNSQDSEVQQRETTNANGDRQIDVLIVNKVKEAFGNGVMDSTMKNAYGLNRRGY